MLSTRKAAGPQLLLPNTPARQRSGNTDLCHQRATGTPVSPAGRRAGRVCAAGREGSPAAPRGPGVQEGQRQLVAGRASGGTAWPRSPGTNGAVCFTPSGSEAAGERLERGCCLHTPGASLARLGAGVSRKEWEALRFTEMEILIFLISILVVSKLEKEVWKASLPLIHTQAVMDAVEMKFGGVGEENCASAESF